MYRLYSRPLSMSENLTRLAQKIDFSKPITEDIKSESGDEKSEDSVPDTASSSAISNPFEAIASKIR